MSATVYFSKDITPEKVLELYQLVGKELPGKVAIKLHSGEKGNQNFLKPEFWKPIIDHVGGTVVECNTAYDGERNVTERHVRLLADHGWSKHFPVDLLDAQGILFWSEIPMWGIRFSEVTLSDPVVVERGLTMAPMILKLNPFYYIAAGYRDSMLTGDGFWMRPTLGLYFWGVTIVMMLVGLKVFKRLRPHFSDVL